MKSNTGQDNGNSFKQQANQSQYGVSPVAYHRHTGVDSPIIGNLNIVPSKTLNGDFFYSISIGGFTIYNGNGILFEPVNDGNNKAIPNAVAILSQSTGFVSGANGTVSNATASVPTGTDTLVALASGFFNGITWDTSTNAFVIITAGQYLVSGVVTYASLISGKLYKTEIFVNGSVVAETGAQSAVTGSGVATVSTCVTIVLNLNVGDSVQLYTFQNSGSTESVAGGSPLGYLSIAQV